GAAMHAAAEVATALALPLTVLHVSRDDSSESARALDEARRYLHSYDLPLTCQAMAGAPHQTIVDVIRQGGHDLLFIGAYGHSRIIEMVLGSTTEYVLRNSPCPVFLAR